MTDPNPDTPTSGGIAASEQSIAVLVSHNPVIVLIDEKKREQLFDHIEKELAEFVPDLTTTAGREKIRRFAAKITKTKTAADKAGLDLTAEAREKIATINGARKVLKERLEALADRARQPLTDWEDAEKKRLEGCEEDIAAFTRAGVVGIDESAERVRERLTDLQQQEIDPARFQGMTEAAIKARNHSAEMLKGALARIEQQEAERAELERLRAEAVERQREAAAAAEREAAEREAREAEERAQREAAEAEERAKAEAAEAARREEEARQAAAREAEERAKREAEEAARREAEERQRAHEKALRAEREAREAAEAEARAAQERAAAAAREQEEAREREEAAAEAERQRIARIEADEAHRTKCKREAKGAIMTTGVSEDQAQKIVLLIIAGEVPRTKLDFAAPARERATPVAETLV